MAVLAAFAASGSVAEAGESLASYLRDRVFAATEFDQVDPDPVDAAGFAAYLIRYRSGLDIERAAVAAI
jgi:hypothetical protein